MTDEESRQIEILAATTAKREAQREVAVLTERVTNVQEILRRIESGVLSTNTGLMGEGGISQRLRVLEASEKTCPAKLQFEALADKVSVRADEIEVLRQETAGALAEVRKDLAVQKEGAKSNSRWWSLILGGTLLATAIEKLKLWLGW